VVNDNICYHVLRRHPSLLSFPFKSVILGECHQGSVMRFSAMRFSANAVVTAERCAREAYPASFSEDLASQIADFQLNGFVLIKMPKENGKYDHYNGDVVTKVREEIHEHFKSTQDTLEYRWWRKWNSVNTSDSRHSTALPLTPLLYSLLKDSISSMSEFLNTQLPGAAPLVELSTVIALPGAGFQAIHTDIPFPKCDRHSNETLILTAMLALTDIKKAMGPTFMVTASNSRAFHAKHRRGIKNNNDTIYDSYGDVISYQTMQQDYDDAEADRMYAKAEESSISLSSKDPAWIPTDTCYAGLRKGDILLFDAKLFHFGGANTTTDQSRDLLSWSFQKPIPPPGHSKGDVHSIKPIDGFTYHITKDLHHKYTLQDFIK
jgi:hypothetical protein